MKVTFIITLISLAIIHQSTSAGITEYGNRTCYGKRIDDETGNAFSLDYCKTLDLENYYRCCYAHYKTDKGTARGCYPVNYTAYKNLNDYIDKLEEEGKKDVSIDCNSKYLTIAASLITLVFILL